ncbi:MAG TPA: DEAD/DEAH box helicase [Bacteroidales bacterium]|nr:DEAD/DEAH box helicase [Bacteroidales bacterium]
MQTDTMTLDYFHPAIRNWFLSRFKEPTDVQLLAWPAIQNNQYTLLAAPTGSGKTLAAFLVAIDEIVKMGIAGSLLQQTSVVYISPLKALGNDIQRNLQEPLMGITDELGKEGHSEFKIKVAVRTGDTTASERAAMLRVPPHILVTTPESLYLLLTSANGRKMLSNVRSVIVDEIHAMVDDKRGSHLSLSLERLENLVSLPIKRIGLSATQKPIERVADFLKGNGKEAFCEIINNSQSRRYDVALVLPHSPLSAVMSNEIWTEVHQKLVELIREHQTTLIFVNTRRLAERLTHSLDPFIGKENITAHHGSMSKKHRENAEQQLKTGKLKALVATASLELGIDIGSVDLVVQISSPRSISKLIQRLGRSRHYVGGVPKGRLVPLTLNDLLECTALIDCLQRGELDELHIPEKPYDVLAQQIVAELSARDYEYYELYSLIKRAYPYGSLTENEYAEIIEKLANGYTSKKGRVSAYIFYDKVNMLLKARRAARLVAITNGGTIPDTFDYDVILEPENTVIGTVYEDFAMESLTGDIFQLGNSSWRIKKIGNGKIWVEDAHGLPPDMPFWMGEAPGRTVELSFAVSRLIKAIDEKIFIAQQHTTIAADWLANNYQLSPEAADQLVNYLAYTKAALGGLPTTDMVILERFFDQAGDVHLVIHSVFGTRMNRAWGLALRKRFSRIFNFELQAAATENAIVLSFGPTHSFPINEVFSYLNSHEVTKVLVQALLESPVFEVRWRWNASTALAIARRRGGKKVPAQLQRMQAEDLIVLVFPEVLNMDDDAGKRDITGHFLVDQTLYDCLYEAMDITTLTALLEGIQQTKIQTIAIDMREPSPMAQEVLVAQPYAFLDNAPLEERRVRAVYYRRWSGKEEASSMGQLDPLAIQKVTDEVWPRVRNADELYDALMVSGALTVQEIDSKHELTQWQPFFNELIAQNSATQLFHPDSKQQYWVAVERLHEMMRVTPLYTMNPLIPIPENISKLAADIDNPLVEIVRSRLSMSGPVTLRYLKDLLPVSPADIENALHVLEKEGFVFRGHFHHDEVEEWCERHLLARIHRYTLDKLRSAIQPVSPSEFMHFLFHWQKVLSGEEHVTVENVLDQLEGYEAQSVAWEGDILSSRIKSYNYTSLDLLLLRGEYIWGRFKTGKLTGNQFSSVPIRTTPIAFIRRSNLRYYQVPEQQEILESLSVYARQIYQQLHSGGAQFFNQLLENSRLLQSQLEDALTELISVGQATSDSFTGLRTLLIPDKYFSNRHRSGKVMFNFQQAGRWWLIPSGEATEDGPLPEDYVVNVANMLLKRYGVVFRKLAEKERLLFMWYDMLKVYRKMEAQGIIRGGRFVDGFGGEQYALPEAVTFLREIKSGESTEELVSISAADPLNLTGFITPGPRVASLYSNRILYRQGIPVAIKEGKDVQFLNAMDEETQWKLKKLLIHHNVQPELRPYLAYS